jgi:hypothetical protein
MSVEWANYMVAAWNQLRGESKPIDRFSSTTGCILDCMLPVFATTTSTQGLWLPYSGIIDWELSKKEEDNDTSKGTWLSLGHERSR